MRSRVVVLVVLLVMAAAAAAWYWMRPAPPAATQSRVPAAAVAAEPDRRLDLGTSRDRAALEAALESAYRLTADRRLVAAFADVRALLGGSAAHPVARATWADDHWLVGCDADSAGTLPERPGFDDALAALGPWARRQLARDSLPAGSPDGVVTGLANDFLPEEALARIDEIAGRDGITRALLGQGLVACTELALLQAEDRSGFADITMARALALLAVVRACDGRPHRREAAALAWAMGYRREAAAGAATLAAGDPLRRLVCGALSGSDSAAASTREARICRLLALAHRDLSDRWLALAGTAAGPRAHPWRAVLSTALAFRRFDVSARIGDLLIEVACDDLDGVPSPADADAATLTAFERSVAAMRPGRLSGTAIASARRATFYSGLVALHEFGAEQRASVDDVAGMNRALGPAEGGPGGWFVRWQRHLVVAMAGAANDDALRADLRDPRVPPPLALLTFDQLTRSLFSSGVPARAAVRGLAAKLDSRPASAFRYALIAQETLCWPVLAERWLAHAAGELGTEESGAAILLARMRMDLPRLQAVIRDPDTDPGIAMGALRLWVEADSSAADGLLPRFAQLRARDPASWDLTRPLADLLEARGRPGEAERVVRGWMAAADSTQDALDSTFAVTTLARLQREQGRVAEALHTIGNLDRCQQRGAMEEKATLLALAGRGDEALTVARAIVDRYPDRPAAHTFEILLLWRLGRYDEAAARLAAPGADSTFSPGEMADGFADIFRGRHDEALRALAATRGVVPSMAERNWTFAQAFARAGDLPFAARLVTQSSPGSGSRRAFGLATAFDLLARAQGEPAAWAWLERQNMGADAREMLGGLLLTSMYPASAYALAAGGAQADADEYAWLLRAAAWKLDGRRRNDWRDAIRAHESAAGDGLYPQLARYLLGERPEADVLASADSPKRRNEVWFYCGLNAWAEARPRDALLWWNLCQEAGMTSDGEWAWSLGKLVEWAQDWRVAGDLPRAEPRHGVAAARPA